MWLTCQLSSYWSVPWQHDVTAPKEYATGKHFPGEAAGSIAAKSASVLLECSCLEIEMLV